ncbi:DNA-directed RNA polymerase II subunit RPB1-like [Penaeus monodon]|uniref:DNA-directed RNA polymerase II subunit RPB1-like n=1 Tax=Penaeus monodon TaxID=6687 RepID=UPI0018A70983|nr:DNA-directed RNA polymerase II subunit RPB1-like [Penaeus monodon]
MEHRLLPPESPVWEAGEVDEGAVYESSSPGSPAYTSFSGVLLVPTGVRTSPSSGVVQHSVSKPRPPAVSPSSYPYEHSDFPYILRAPMTPSYIPAFSPSHPVGPPAPPTSSLFPLGPTPDRTDVPSPVDVRNRTPSVYIPLVTSTHLNSPPYIVRLHPLQDSDGRTPHTSLGHSSFGNTFHTQTRTNFDASGYVPSHGKRPLFTKTEGHRVPSRTGYVYNRKPLLNTAVPEVSLALEVILPTKTLVSRTSSILTNSSDTRL